MTLAGETHLDDGAGTVTELRVHGVGGESPEDLLGVPNVELVAGTNEAGFFRPSSWLPSSTEADHLEAYSWGGITSRSRSRALWIILLPFAMLNIAGWMFSPGEEGQGRGMSVMMARVAALLNTAIFTSMFGVLLVDVMGNQCAVSDGCNQTWFMGPWRWWASSPPRAMAVSVLVLGLLMLGVAWVARWARSDGAKNRHGRLGGDPARRVDLESPDLWRRGDVAHWLGMSHLSLALGIATLLGVEAGARYRAIGEGERPSFFESLTLLDSLTIGLWVALSLGLVSVVASIGLVTHLGPVSRRLLLPVLVASVLGVVTTVVALFTLPADAALVGVAPENLASVVMVQSVSRMIFGAFAALFVVFWVWYLCRVTSRLIQPSPSGLTGETIDLRSVASLPTGSGRGENFVRWLRVHFARVWINDNDPVISLQAVVPLFGAGVVVTVGASVILQFQRMLGTDYPEERLTEVAVFGFCWIVVLIAVGVAGWISAPGRLPSQIAGDFDQPIDPDDPEDRAWLKRISSAESAAQITDRSETLMTIPALIVLVGLIALHLLGLHDQLLRVSGPAVWGLSLLPVVLMTAMNRLYQDRDFRRALGTVWDVATFWPRWFHPWAPPSYGERAVDQLRRRLEVLTETGGVVLSGHSQGTVVCAAALAQLDPEHRSRVAVITHGSPLTRIYGRYFGEFFTTETLTKVADDLVASDGASSWRNLYRRTDYIGGPINSRIPSSEVPSEEPSSEEPSEDSERCSRGIDDVLLRDPHDPEPLMRGDPRPVTLKHSDYYADPVYAATVREFADRLQVTLVPASEPT